MSSNEGDPHTDDSVRPYHRKMTDAERKTAWSLHWDWLRFIALCGGFGVAIGILAASIVIHADVGGIGAMVARSPHSFGTKLLLAAGFAHTFGIVAMGIGIMIRSDLQ